MTVHAQFDAHTGILPCCNRHWLEYFDSGHHMTDNPNQVTCGKAAD